MPNGNGIGAPPGPPNNAATNNPQPPPPPPPPPPPQAEPEANLAVDWNGAGGSFSGFVLDEHFPFV
ncbi:hypothetical protein FRC19_006511 [Serendipita sp. 401]|nr:hypothetical protein FRC19_006511 [Serendipita sp. 401]